MLLEESLRRIEDSISSDRQGHRWEGLMLREKYWKDKWQANRVNVKIVLSDIEKQES